MTGLASSWAFSCPLRQETRLLPSSGHSEESLPVWVSEVSVSPTKRELKSRHLVSLKSVPFWVAIELEILLSISPEVSVDSNNQPLNHPTGGGQHLTVCT